MNIFYAQLDHNAAESFPIVCFGWSEAEALGKIKLEILRLIQEPRALDSDYLEQQYLQTMIGMILDAETFAKLQEAVTWFRDSSLVMYYLSEIKPIDLPETASEITEVERRILEALSTKNGQSAPELARAIGMSVSTVRRHMMFLENRGDVETVGSGSARTYWR